MIAMITQRLWIWHPRIPSVPGVNGREIVPRGVLRRPRRHLVRVFFLSITADVHTSARSNFGYDICLGIASRRGIFSRGGKARST